MTEDDISALCRLLDRDPDPGPFEKGIAEHLDPGRQFA
jgi:hypothetical protein